MMSNTNKRKAIRKIMVIFSRRKICTVFVILLGFIGSNSLYARELNSLNVASGLYYTCPISATQCFIGSKGITSIASGTFAGYHNLQFLRLDSNKLTSIDAGSFNGLTNLQELYLSNNQIASFAPNAFAGLTNLQHLNLERNQVTALSSGTFNGLTNLQELTLYHNNITSLSSGTFTGLTNLQSLHLGGNGLKSIEDGAFQELNNLELLQLRTNEISALSSGTFIGLTNLQSLHLEGNEISSITGDIFIYLESLEEISLRYNQIASLASNTFAGLSNLQSLDLGSNEISSIAIDTFNNLSGLTSLDLKNNQITELSSGVFSSLSSLQYLKLNSNQISTISADILRGLSSLLSLNLDDNQLTVVQPEIFEELTNLQFLSLNYNCLDSENKGMNEVSYMMPVSSYTVASADNISFDIAGIVSDFSSSTYTLSTNDQNVCVGIQYSPETSTSGDVTGSLKFYGPISKIETLQEENSNLSMYDYIFTDNGTGVLDYSTIIDTNDYLWINNMDFDKTITGTVTWIDKIAPGAPTIITPINETAISENTENGTTLRFDGEAESGSIVTIYISGQIYTGISDNNGIYNITTLLALPAGNYTVRLTATDHVGNISPESIVTIRVIAPSLSSPTYTQGGGGGGTANITKDNCPNGDFTASYYDKFCGTPDTTTGHNSAGAQPSSKPQNGATETLTYTEKEIYNDTIANNYCYTRSLDLTVKRKITTIFTPDEFNKALTFLYSYGVTSYNNIDQFKPNALLSREQAAKMFSNFAINVLCRKPNTALSKNYSDIDSANDTLRPYITLAYQLGLMQGTPDGMFRPQDNITKAEVNAILIRLLLENYLQEDQEKIRHSEYSKVSNQLNILQTEETTETEDKSITRQDTFLMLFRGYKYQTFVLHNSYYSLENRESFMPNYLP